MLNVDKWKKVGHQMTIMLCIIYSSFIELEPIFSGNRAIEFILGASCEDGQE